MGISFGFAAGVQPGPLQTFVISRTLNYGWRPTLPAAAAPIISDLPIVALVLLILNNLPLWVENVLHFGGGLFVLFLAWGAFKSFRHYSMQQAAPVKSGRRNLIDAVLMNLLNPNPYLTWSLVLGPILLQGWRESPANGIGLIAGFYGAIIATTAGIILLFGTVRRFGPKVSRILLGISAVALAGFGFYQLYLGAAALWLK
jgi:threonine/homoserine/homoserine lactone efflux protein